MEIFESHPFVDYEEACLMMEGRGEEMVKSLILHNLLLYATTRSMLLIFLMLQKVQSFAHSLQWNDMQWSK